MALVEESSMFNTNDDAYEFSAPRFFDFISEDLENDDCRAETWFDSSLSYAPSQKSAAFSPEFETTRSDQVASLLDPGEAEQSKKVYVEEMICGEAKEVACTHENASVNFEAVATKDKKFVKDEARTPKMIPKNGDLLQTYSKSNQTVKKTATTVIKPSSLQSQIQPQNSHGKSTKPTSVRRETILQKNIGTPNFALENQPIKRQKLEGGQSRQILSIKTQNLPHKRRPGLVSCSSHLGSPTAKARKDDRKFYMREPAAPFVSMAEMMQKFESNTREKSLPCKSGSPIHDGTASMSHRKPKLTLTRPKEPKFETSQRVRPIRTKSFAEFEEKTKAKIPKFKARPMSNKKILEVPTLPIPPRSRPHQPEVKELHLETMERASQNAETAMAAPAAAPQHHQRIPHLTAPKSPLLQTCLRARIKSSVETRKEELGEVSTFKAKPVNRKVLESKGDLGISFRTKKAVTVPKEFRFATNDRIPTPVTVSDLFEKLSVNSGRRHSKQIPRNTTPNPFHLHTKERALEKERKFVSEAQEKELAEERGRVGKAKPYTIDHPKIPPKSTREDCTNPEPFELERLVRDEEGIQREREERERLRIEKEKAQLRAFLARPNMKENPILVPERVSKPETGSGILSVDYQAVHIAESDKNKRGP